MVKINDLDPQIQQLPHCKTTREFELKAPYTRQRGRGSGEQCAGVDLPVTVCDNIHGQVYDFEELFRVGSNVPESNYLFMGDFMDCGF